MKKQITKYALCFFWMKALLFSYSLEFNTSYDYFRGLPDGSWNGNSGAFVAINTGAYAADWLAFQVGGSYGLYNWDGRGNVVFENPKKVEQIGFITAATSFKTCHWRGGVAYDCLFTRNFGIYAQNPFIDQIRWQTGYSSQSDEVGFWGTFNLGTTHKSALGIPVNFKAMGQMSVFWRHFFQNCAESNIWFGIPYPNSLMFPSQKAGEFLAGFSFRAPLTARLFIDGNGSYMASRSSPGVIQTRNYGAAVCVGITYSLSSFSRHPCPCYETPYMPIANHSNFFVDTNVNE